MMCEQAEARVQAPDKIKHSESLIADQVCPFHVTGVTLLRGFSNLTEDPLMSPTDDRSTPTSSKPVRIQPGSEPMAVVYQETLFILIRYKSKR